MSRVRMGKLDEDATCAKEGCGAELKAGDRVRFFAGRPYGLRCHAKKRDAPTSKVMVFWLEKRQKKPRMLGLATAEGSAVNIWTLAQEAMRGKGRLFIVEGESAEHGRYLIDGWLKGQERVAMCQVVTARDKKVIVAMGLAGVAAVAGSSAVVSKYIGKDGAPLQLPMGDDVYARALPADWHNRLEETMTLDNVFGITRES